MLGTPKEVAILYANKVLVNFTGTEFLVTVYAAFPEPWTGKRGSPLPKKVVARPLGRYAFSIPEWYGAVKSFDGQIQRLVTEGAFRVEEGQALGGEEVPVEAKKE